MRRLLVALVAPPLVPLALAHVEGLIGCRRETGSPTKAKAGSFGKRSVEDPFQSYGPSYRLPGTHSLRAVPLRF
jgi:hypothetical protein